MRTRICGLFGLIVIFASCSITFSQTMNPRWIGEMPAPERILREINGKDEQDTIERQMGVFKHLVEIIHSMAYGLERRYLPSKATPDEQRMRVIYIKAFDELSYKAKNRDGWTNYVHNWDLHFEMMDKFFSKNFHDLYRQSDKNSAEAYERNRKESAGVVMGGDAVNANGVKPGSPAELRKCVESGRSMRVCGSEVGSNGMEQLTGFNLNLPIPPGPRMTGDYGTAQGLRLIFQPHVVNISCRNVSHPRAYTVELTDTQALVKIANGDGSIGLTLRPDGKLAGSGPGKVTGWVTTGGYTENVQTYGPAGEIIYGQRQVIEGNTRTVNCNLGLFNVLGSTPLPPNLANPIEYLTTIFSGMKVMAKGGNAKAALNEMVGIDKAPAPGIRLHGIYASATGLSLAFHPESVTLVCGESEQAVEYSVQRTANQIQLKLLGFGGPINLVRKPNGSFFGTGNVQVNGRKIIGSTNDPDNPFKFAPMVNRCDFGTLDLDTNPTGSGTSAAAQKGDLGVAMNFQGRPMVGIGVLLFKESFESLLKKQGFQASPGTAGKTAIDVYAEACKAKDPKCDAANQAIGKLPVAVLQTNAAGRADFSGLPVGDYWFVAMGASKSRGRAYLWTMHVEITTAGMATTLDERNTVVEW